MRPRVFGVDYQFLSCGDVFTQGLVHAAEELGLDYAHADWNTPALDVQVQRFTPDLLFVVHGRKFSQRWSRLWQSSAVWLLDEPYEVDDTSTFSSRFDHVFVNDPSTLARHPRSSYLPVCYDPRVHSASLFEPGLRIHDVGFVGGGNPTRDRYLAALGRAGVLSYVVGGTWSDPAVTRVCLSRNLNPSGTAALYRQTRIVVNVFREKHHFNRDHLPATSLNPRVYEALACGALVVSEWRPEVDTLVPELPTFRTVDECVSIVSALLADPNAAEAIRVRCMERLAPHTYAARLQTVLTTVGSVVAA
jgi:hypothetical protein